MLSAEEVSRFDPFDGRLPVEEIRLIAFKLLWLMGRFRAFRLLSVIEEELSIIGYRSFIILERFLVGCSLLVFGSLISEDEAELVAVRRFALSP